MQPHLSHPSSLLALSFTSSFKTPSLRRWLLHNKQHLVLISSTQKQHEDLGGQTWKACRNFFSHCWGSLRSLMVEEWASTRLSPLQTILLLTPPLLWFVTCLRHNKRPSPSHEETLKQGKDEEGRTLPYPQKRICNSAASSPNYSGALLKSATKAGRRERSKRRERKNVRKGKRKANVTNVSRGDREERFTSFYSQFRTQIHTESMLTFTNTQLHRVSANLSIRFYSALLH